MARQIWTKEEDLIMMEKYANIPSGQLANELHRSLRSIYSRSNTLNISKSVAFMKSINSGRNNVVSERAIATRFKKGFTPWNKGQKGLNIGGVETQFKKGHKPHNTKEDNFISPRRDKSGHIYLYIRITESKWIPLHRHIWEKVNGPIPQRMNLRFIDGNTLNCTLSNLTLISKRNNMIRNSFINYPLPIQDLIHIKAAFTRQINKKQKTA